MKKSVHLVNANGNHRIIKMGFCWVGFFVPGLWAMSEGLWRLFAFSALFPSFASLFSDAADQLQRRSLSNAASLLNLTADLAVVACLLTMLCTGLFGKRWLVGRLLRQGYVERPSQVSRNSGQQRA
jgi:hypothetical protein